MAQQQPHKGQRESAATDEAWVSVIRKMDEAYADLVRYQVQVEEQNTALEEAHSFFDSVQSAMSDVLIACDHEGRIQQVNRAFEELTGRTMSSLLDQPMEHLCSGESRARLIDCLKRVRREPVRDEQISIEGVQGPVPLALNCSPRFNQRGRLVGVVVAGRPVGELQRAFNELNQAHAELKLAQERLIQAEKMASLGRLVAGVAHELNNPISFVYGNMHALQRYTRRLVEYFDLVQSGASREQLRELREKLRLDRVIADLDSLVEGTMEGADRVREIVNDLRQFSSTQRSEKAPFDLVHVVRSALHWIIKESRAGIQVEEELPERLKAVGHSGQIHQVVVNLIQNAADAVAERVQPSLSLTAGQTDTLIWFEVADNGPGIPPENLPHLFDPFFTTKPTGQGTGLGLSISYGIVAEHGGTLSIENRPEGGARARLTLPLGEGGEDNG
ncbi:Signal transduction histidine kinase HoxJ (hydrogenase regulation) [Marinobacterium lacunae]|uniref:histidine kinase n=1 Tax=Marinobacterium lacunae TaxID=1232683 RepID=A0A081G002_9GAMM|nr:ATP-binding protein [Marinobacterium lacunae]KEA64107.1 Signal transduction histidine kinase HoxJ (hydrogenase regulation) [Marinobacterium lacunae]